MRIGVVSDTHDHLANVARIVETPHDTGVERVVHLRRAETPDSLPECAGGLRGHDALGVVQLDRRAAGVELF